MKVLRALKISGGLLTAMSVGLCVLTAIRAGFAKDWISVGALAVLTFVQIARNSRENALAGSIKNMQDWR